MPVVILLLLHPCLPIKRQTGESKKLHVATHVCTLRTLFSHPVTRYSLFFSSPPPSPAPLPSIVLVILQGATETILAVGLGNLFYSIFSGQPLVVLGPTGPTLIFEQLMAAFCRMQGIPFLEFRFWIGLWTALFIFALVGFNSSAITRLFTRFTEEIFTVLIGLVFIYEALSALWKIHVRKPYNRWIVYPTKERRCDCFLFPDAESRETMNLTNATRLRSFWDEGVGLHNCSGALHGYVGQYCPSSLVEHPDVFLMSVILFFGTFLFCIYFKKIRNSRFLRSYVSRCDFLPPLLSTF